MLKDKKMGTIYITTEKECTNSIKKSKRTVCTYCGGKREAIETVDIGTTEKIYNIALKMVNEGLVSYSHIVKEKTDSSLYKLIQTSGAVELVTKVLNYAKG
jgi:hypothetical protein